MLESWTQVETAFGVGCPCASSRWFFMDEDANTGRCEWRLVEIEDAINLGLGGETRVDARGPEEVQSEKRLREQPVPKVERKVWVGAAQPSDEMVFEGADGTFGCIRAVVVRRYQLIVDMICGHLLEESSGGFVVQSNVLRGEATGAEGIEDSFVGGGAVGAGAGLHGLGKDGVAVVVVDDQDIVAAGVRRGDETACEVRVELAGDFKTVEEHVVEAVFRGMADGGRSETFNGVSGIEGVDAKCVGSNQLCGCLARWLGSGGALVFS
jgi:hypothetical protein